MLLRKNEDYFEEQSLDTILNLQREPENNYSLDYSLAELAKKITGMSVMNYPLSCRMASAKNFLAESNLSIGEITEICGFSDNSNFSRTFKKLNGISPTKFISNYKQLADEIQTRHA